MIKVFLTVRNRLAMTKKCFKALRVHSTLPYQLYVYDNQTNHLVDEHFSYFSKLYNQGLLTQVTFNTTASTFNAFSKATACNMFGLQHEQDPNKDDFMFLVFLDNDIIVTPEWDKKLKIAWNYVRKNKLKHIKVIGQLPGGIRYKTIKLDIGEMKGLVGKLGGSGLWSVRPNFFRDVGFLDLKKLIGHNKKHDQNYWLLLEKASKGEPYILGLREKLGVHCGTAAGSLCNRLTSNRGREDKEKYELIKFKQAEKDIEAMDFNTFYKSIINDKALLADW